MITSSDITLLGPIVGLAASAVGFIGRAYADHHIEKYEAKYPFTSTAQDIRYRFMTMFYALCHLLVVGPVLLLLLWFFLNIASFILEGKPIKVRI